MTESVPFISDTGVLPPESAIFTYFFNIGSLLVAITVYIRFKIISTKCNNKAGQTSLAKTTERLNNISLVFGIITFIGLSIIGNFRSSEMNSTHNFGTYLTCVFGTFDIIIQSKIAFNNDYTKISILRIIIVSIIIPCFLGYVFIKKFINYEIDHNVDRRASISHDISAISEWIGFCMFGPFYATFILEFREIKSFKIVFIFSTTENDFDTNKDH